MLDEAHGPTRRVLTLLVERRCNSYCVFCGQREVDEALIHSRRRLGLTLPETKFGHVRERYTLETATRAIEDARRAGTTELSLQGGEPTIWPDLVPLVRRARELAFEHVNLVTNGRRLADRAYAEALLEAGLDGLTVSFLGADASTHDELMAAPGAFDALVAGLGHVRAHGGRATVSANVITSARSFRELPAIVRRLADLGVSSASLHLVRFDGLASDPAVRGALAFDARELAGPLAEAAREAARLGLGFDASDVPLCLHAPPPRAEDVRALARRGSIAEHTFEAAGFTYQAGAKRRDDASSACARCLVAARCHRIEAAYLPGDAAASLAPVTAPSLAASVDAALASLDPRAPTAVDEVRALLDAVVALARLVPGGSLSAIDARVRGSLVDLLPFACVRRDATALSHAVHARLGLHPRRVVHVDDGAWRRMVGARRHAPEGAAEAGDARRAHRVTFGGAFTLLVRGQVDADGWLVIEAARPAPGPATTPADRLLERAAELLLATPIAAARRLRLRADRVELDDGGGPRCLVVVAEPGAVRIEPPAALAG
jgi:MoaA/NifB/PqqE/SkfB family radical SAM enzyme